ncbi:MAG: molybdate ABC transporter substrate-binding protein [Myxococcales bacterium]
MSPRPSRRSAGSSRPRPGSASCSPSAPRDSWRGSSSRERRSTPSPRRASPSWTRWWPPAPATGRPGAPTPAGASRCGRGAKLPRRSRELAEPRFVHVAIANPEHAPYGAAARQALVTAGLWEGLRERVVYGENVRQALQLAETGNADAAIVALSLVVQKKDGRYLLLDESLHRPLEQGLVACRKGERFEGGKAFVAFVGRPGAQATMRRYGFGAPGGAAGAP